MEQYFPPYYQFYKLFNKNTVKISYRCTRERNIKKILRSRISTEQRICNYLDKDTGPLEQNCFTTNIVYKTEETTNNGIY